MIQTGWAKLRRLGHTGWGRSLLILVVLVVTIRLIPFLMPIRAASLVQQQQAIEFRDRHNFPLGTILTRDQEHTVAVPLNQISPTFLQAILAAEDQRFYQHGAIDLWAVARAIRDSWQAQRIVSGASTITMQLARMIAPVPRNLLGKSQEIWMAWRLAAGMTKAEILHAYVNRLPMGGNIYGIEAAARVYLGTSAAQLNLAQASFLAGIPNDPINLHPHDGFNRLKQRQRYVLDRMVANRWITPVEAERAYGEEIALQDRQQGILAAPHLLFWLADRLTKTTAATVKTTIDLPLQQFVETQVRQVVQSLYAHNVRHAAAVVIANATGEVLAYVGSPDYFAEASLGRNDGVQALRQPGSTLKPFLYELALEKRLIRPNTILQDVPTYYAIPGAMLYSPVDYSERFQGPVRPRIALANSLNVPTVRLLEQVGVDLFLDRLHQLGFMSLTQKPEHYGLGLGLGSGEISLWELARAYVVMARSGQMTHLQTILDPLKEDIEAVGASLPAAATEWGLIIDMLKDRYARARAFGVDSVLSLPFDAAVKTGTSSNYRDNWTVGFSRHYTVATWVGNFDGSLMHRVSGIIGAAPLWNRIMLHLHERQEPPALPPPPDLVLRPICATTGAKPQPACSSVTQEYFYPEDLVAYDRDSTSETNPQGLKIVSPLDQDLFLIKPQGDTASNRLEFRVINPTTRPVEWRLNGRVIAGQNLQQTNSSVFWTLQPGLWILQVSDGQTSDRVQFRVEVAEPAQQRRGFSLR